jgi:hypothetical protein
LDIESLLNEYEERESMGLYPKVMIPGGVKRTLRQKPKEKSTRRFGPISIGVAVISLLFLYYLSTPFKWLGLLGTCAAILYDRTRGYKLRKEKDDQANIKIRQILNDPKLLREYIVNRAKQKLRKVYHNTIKSDAKVGKHDETLFDAIKVIPNSITKRGEGLLPSLFTPDVILNILTINVWVDLEVDEPWFKNDDGHKEPSHYLGKDCDRDEQFLKANWMVIRFAEEHVASQPKSCAKETAKLLTLFGFDVLHNFTDIKDLEPVKQWTKDEALAIPRW